MEKRDSLSLIKLGGRWRGFKKRKWKKIVGGRESDWVIVGNKKETQIKIAVCPVCWLASKQR